MKNFSIQWLGLMMMMVLMLSEMVSTTPTPMPKEETEKNRQLKQIREEASKNSSLHMNMTKVSGSEIRCVEKFFCLAEEALQLAKKNHNGPFVHGKKEFSPDKLIHLLHEYNRLNGIDTCHLKNRQYNLTSFLEDVRECADFRL